MIEKKLRIAVVSDLHCHPSSKVDETGRRIDATYLYSDLLRNPEHPIESLTDLLKEEKVDLILCPGDFTNQSDKQGFISGWNYALELKDHFKADEIIATIGNHDVDSRNNYSDYSIEIPKKIKKNFPFKNDELRKSFWAEGFAFIEKDNFRILVINSCHFHFNKNKSTSGEVDSDLLKSVDDYLNENTEHKIQLMMCHHHPVRHSMFNLGEEDEIINSENLLNLLRKHKFDLIIHGHKHNPLLTYCNPTNINKIAIFSSGSFSAKTNLSYTGIKNFFHIIDIQKDNEVKGVIKSWTYQPQVGWQKKYEENTFMPPCTGFGSKKTTTQIVNEIVDLLNNKMYEKWENVRNLIPDIDCVIPEEAKRIQKELEDRNYALDKDFNNFPNRIYNNNKLDQEYGG
ncbi:metallophosphoesterase family protein [Flavobacterium oreochromis]|uniref:Uncharacterized protein n=1 Tax=Flavobacterium columnare TaxID=996 RepID=A0A2D0AHU6_9FLAO|nr:metallophosphoesterase [Flavobacterium oreochromis]OWP77681.1 hypothetical protein BWK62_06940 [Flavobacterium oreochromis]